MCVCPETDLIATFWKQGRRKSLTGPPLAKNSEHVPLLLSPSQMSLVKIRLPVAAVRSASSSHSLSPYWEMKSWRWKVSKSLQNTTRNHHCFIFPSCWDLSSLKLWGVLLHKAGAAKGRKFPDHDGCRWHSLWSSSLKYVSGYSSATPLP